MKRELREHKDIEYYLQLPYPILLHEITDEGEKYWIAEIPDLPGCKSHGSTIEGAVKSVEEAKKDWILDTLEEGEEVPTPNDLDKFSGKTLVRMSRSLHRALALLAESEKLSLNQLVVTMLAKEVGRLDALNRVEEKLEGLLVKVNDVVKQSELKISTSMIPVDIDEFYKRCWYQTPRAFGLSPEDKVEVSLTLVDTDTPAVVASTASPFDVIRTYPFIGYQKPGYKWIFSVDKEEKGIESENRVEAKLE